jgi:lysozyme
MAIVQGIDVSRWQPNVDWNRVRGAGISFVFIKATQSNFADPMFTKHWAGAREAGLLRGAYHYLVGDMDGEKQAAVTLKVLGDDPGELPPVCDVEAKTSSPAQYARYAQIWLDRVEAALGRRPIVYTAAWYWNSGMIIGGKYPDWAPGYPLWVAAYPLREGFPSPADIEQAKYKPSMPKSWADWTLWQYSERGRVDGVTNNGRLANTDLNAFRGTLQEFTSWAGTSAPAALPVSNGRGPAPVDATRATNIQVINAFVRAFGNQGGQMLQATGLMSKLTARPVDRYSGPAIASMPALSETQKTALNAALAQILSEN